eukprot:Tbor_TRINITY_DN5213_c5_g6::TRINITY_DN5213_c5_g6_i1::g.16234::m.16234
MEGGWNSTVVVNPGEGKRGKYVTSVIATDNGSGRAIGLSKSYAASAITKVSHPGVGPTRHELLDRLALTNTTDRELAPASPSRGGAVVEMVLGKDVSSMYWVPDPSKGEKGLLEMLHIRTTSNSSYIMVASRPDEELARNFSTADDRIFNINDDRFKLSRTSMAFHSLEHVSDWMNLSGKDVKNGLMNTLPNLHVDEFFLLKYRDYSAWANKHFYSESKRDRPLVGSLYVERCFALRVGKEEGVLIPLTEAQLILGYEILLQQALRARASSPNHDSNGDVNFYSGSTKTYSLTSDQFASLGVIVNASAFINPHIQAANEASLGLGGRRDEEGSWAWAWTPMGIMKRMTVAYEQKCTALGRGVVKVLIIGGSVYVLMRFIRGSSSNGKGSETDRDRGGRRRRARADYNSERGGMLEGNRGGMLQSVFGFGPKDVLDVLLA